MSAHPKNAYYASITVMVIGFLVLFALGVWQLYRLQVKNDLIESVKTAALQENSQIPLSQFLSDRKLIYKRGKLEGGFVQRSITLIGPRNIDGRGLSKLAVAAFLPNSGPAVMVALGQVSAQNEDFAKMLQLPAGKVTLLGSMRPSESDSFLKPKNEPSMNRWKRFDSQELASKYGIAWMSPNVFYTEAINENAPPLPLEPIGISGDIPNNHLQYALFWFVLSGIWSVLSFMWIVRPYLYQTDTRPTR